MGASLDQGNGARRGTFFGEAPSHPDSAQQAMNCRNLLHPATSLNILHGEGFSGEGLIFLAWVSKIFTPVQKAHRMVNCHIAQRFDTGPDREHPEPSEERLTEFLTNRCIADDFSTVSY